MSTGPFGSLSMSDLIETALAEDVRDGDWTTLWTVPPGVRTRARIVAKQDLVVAGSEAVLETTRRLSPAIELHALCPDGTWVAEGDLIGEMEGPARAILTAERTFLNVLGRLSGVATLTRAFVEEVAGTGARIVDTRKTTPGWRMLEKAAVRAGGGENHRFGLWDMVLIKENHIAAAGGIWAAIEGVRRENSAGLEIEVEVATLGQIDEIEGLHLDRVLLDNMGLGELRAAVGRVRGWDEPRPLLEASGNMTVERVREVAETGVDLISVGALTHSAPAADISLLFERLAP